MTNAGHSSITWYYVDCCDSNSSEVPQKELSWKLVVKDRMSSEGKRKWMRLDGRWWGVSNCTRHARLHWNYWNIVTFYGFIRKYKLDKVARLYADGITEIFNKEENY